MARQRHRKLLDADTAVVDLHSEWIYVGNMEHWSVHCFGNATGDEYDIEGTNEPVGDGEVTAVDGNEVVIDSETGDAIFDGNAHLGVAFIRVRFTAAAGGGTVTAWFHGLLAQD